jgi:hypothetical protein
MAVEIKSGLKNRGYIKRAFQGFALSGEVVFKNFLPTLKKPNRVRLSPSAC